MSSFNIQTGRWIVEFYDDHSETTEVNIPHLKTKGVDILKKSLCLLIAKFKETGTVSGRRAALRPRKLQDCHYHFIDNAFCVCVRVYVYVYV